MTYLGDYHSGCTVRDAFTTVNTSGVPTVLTGTPAPTLTAWKDSMGSCSTAGVTLAINCSGATGVNAWSVNTNADLTFYACGHDYLLTITGGTVSSNCVSGYVVARFSLDNRSALRPQTHGRTLHVTASGSAGVNWAHVENCTTAVTLSCTTLYSAVKIVDRPIVDACSTVFSVQSVLNAVPAVTSVADKTGYALSAAAVDCIGFTTVTEPANVPGWPANLRTALGWLLALGSNCITQTSATQSVCNRAASSTLASAPITCSATIVHRGSFS